MKKNSKKRKLKNSISGGSDLICWESKGAFLAPSREKNDMYYSWKVADPSLTFLLTISSYGHGVDTDLNFTEIRYEERFFFLFINKIIIVDYIKPFNFKLILICYPILSNFKPLGYQ